jgi:circadian clock protein KaiC
VVLLDGFQGADPLLPEGLSMRALLSALAIQIRYLDVTILITMAGEVRDPRFHTEMTVADVAIGLAYTVQGRRHQRLLEVVKLRGRAQRPGLHSYSIDGNGLHVFPRIESYPTPEQGALTTERAAFNLPELDRLLGGGPNVGTATLLAGAPGVGKTTMGLYWATAKAQPDSLSLFLTFVEYPEQLQYKAAAFGLDLQSAIERGSVRVVRLSPVDVNPDRITDIVLAELASGQVQRLIFDDIAVLLHELGDRTRDYFSALNDILYGMNITSLYLLEITPFERLRVDLTNTPLAILGDNVIVVQQYEIAGALRRLLAVLRMRLSFFDRTLRELILDETGIKVLRPEESMLGLLATGAQMSGGVAPEDIRSADEVPGVRGQGPGES